MFLIVLRFDFIEIIMILGFIVFLAFLYSFAKIRNLWENSARKCMFFIVVYRKDVKMLHKVKSMLHVVRQKNYWLLIIKYI